MTEHRFKEDRCLNGQKSMIAILAVHLLGENISTGGDRVLVEMAKRWRRSGTEIVVIGPKHARDFLRSETGAVVKPIGSTIFDHTSSLFAIPFAYFFRTIRSITLARSAGADVYYSGGDFICNVVPGVWAKLRSSRCVKLAVSIHHINALPFTRHGNSLLASTVSYTLQRLSFMLIKRYADTIFVLNASMKTQLPKHGFDPARIVITGAGVDTTHINQSTAISDDQFDACFAGRLNPTKGIFDIPKIWRDVVDQRPDATLLVMGGGDAWRKELLLQIAQQKLQRHIRLAGFIPEPKYYPSMKSCKVLIAPSYEEGFGISMCEAMACGLPVVAYNLPVYRELFADAPTLVPIGDTSAMAKEITALLSNRTQYAHQAATGRATVARHDWERVASTALDAMRLDGHREE